MTIKVDNNRLIFSADQICGRVRLSELKGFFTKELRVDEGTCALVFDGGESKGVVKPGVYTLQSFLGGLCNDMDRRNVSAVLFRTDEMPLPIVCENVLTLEKLFVRIEMKITVSITDHTLFTQHLLGVNDDMTLGTLAAMLQPILQASVTSAVAELSITDITSPQSRDVVLVALRRTAATSLKSYGIEINGVHFVSVANEQYDALQQKSGEIFLMREGVEQEAEIRKVKEHQKFREIESQEVENDLLYLARHAELDTRDVEAVLLERRIQQRQRVRTAIQNGEIEKLKTEAEMQKFLADHDKEQLLRQQEKEILTQIYLSEKEDRETARAHLVARITLENAADLQALHTKIQHEQKMTALKYEGELAAETHKRQIAFQNREQELTRLMLAGQGDKHRLERSEEEHKIAMQKIADDYDHLVRERQLETLRVLDEFDERRRENKHKRQMEEKATDYDHEQRMEEIGAGRQQPAELDRKNVESISIVTQTILVCPKCKNRNPESHHFCAGCGEMLR